MKRIKFTDYESLLRLFREDDVESALEKLFDSKQITEVGINFLARHEEYLLSYDVYFVFDETRKANRGVENLYPNMNDNDKKMMAFLLFNMVGRSTEFTWSKRYTTFMTLKPPVINVNGLIGILMFMSATGNDKKAASHSYTFFEADKEFLKKY